MIRLRGNGLLAAMAAMAVGGMGALPTESERDFTATGDAPAPFKYFDMAKRRYVKIDRDTPADLARKVKADAKRARKAAIRKR